MPGERIGNSNQYLTISGVVSAPAYSWASDNDTGLYRIGANNIGIAANGTKVLDISNTAVTITPATTLSAALTYGGVTLSNAVTGTGNMVLGTSPSIGEPTATSASANNCVILSRTGSSAGTGRIYANSGDMFGVNDGTLYPFTVAQGASSSTLIVGTASVTVGKALVYGGVTLSNSVTGTGSMVLSAAPTFTGTTTVNGNFAVTGTTRTISFEAPGWSGAVAAYLQAGVNTAGTGTGDWLLTNVPTGKGVAWAVNNSNVAVIDSSGRFTVGSSSSPDGGNITAFTTGTSSAEMNIVCASGTANKEAILNFGSTLTGSTRYSGRIYYRNTDNTLRIWAPSTTTDALMLDSSGRLGIGMTPSNVLDITQTQNAASTISISNASAGGAASARSVYSNGTAGVESGILGTGYSPNGVLVANRFYTYVSNAAGLAIANAGPTIFANSSLVEYARFDTSGNLLVGQTSVSTPTGSNYIAVKGRAYINGGGVGGSSAGAVINATNGTDSAALFTTVNNTTNSGQIWFINNNGQVGSVTTNGSSTAFNTSSDLRLKCNVCDAGDAGEIIDQLKVRSWDWKIDGSHEAFGFVAQEEYAVYPKAVSAGDDDPENIKNVWARDDSKLVPMLIKEVQSLRTRLAALENK
jgi:autotransporter-associated beta strand protein